MTLSDQYPVRLVCRLLGVPRSSIYYAAAAAPDETTIRNAILETAEEWPTFGYRRLTAMLRRLDWKVNAKRVRRLMRELHLGGEAPPKSVRTTDSRHAFPRYPNLVKELKIQAPEQVWVADITYVKLDREFIYLAVVMDVFTRLIRGWHLGRSLDQGLTLVALERALAYGTPGIHHSDQGVQYAAAAYVDRLKGLGVAPSMAKVGEPRENGYAERLMRTIKEEEVSLTEYRDLADARRQLGTFIDRIYNTKRIHSSLGYLTPKEFAARWKELPPPRTTTPTGTEDRAPAGADPSAAPGPAPIGAAGRRLLLSVGPECDKSTP
jgi:transposase InsO family protein